MSGTTFILSDDVAIVTDGSGKTSAVSGVPINDLTVLTSTLVSLLVVDSDTFPATAIGFPAQSLLSSLVTDTDTFQSPAITQAQVLQAALVTDADTIPATTVTYIPMLSPALFAADDAFFAAAVSTGSRTLSPPLVTDTDTFLSLFVTLVGVPGGPQQKLKPPPKIQDNDVIFAPRMSIVTGVVFDSDVVRAPVVTALADILPGLVTDSDTVITGTDIAYSNRLRPALVPADDNTGYSSLVSMILQPELKLDGDGILAADVGWQVIADFTEDVDVVFSTDAYSFYPLYPELWADEETIDTYPFFVQALSGGVPVAPREGVLKGSIKRPPQLIGSITTKRAA